MNIVTRNNCYLYKSLNETTNNTENVHLSPSFPKVKNSKNNESPLTFTGNSLLVNLKIYQLKHKRPDLFPHFDMPVTEWIKQFDNNKDKLTALKILNNFEYISFKKARNIFGHLHSQLLKQEDFDLEHTAFSFLGNAKSGGVMGYIYSQAAGFREKGINHHETISGEIKEKFITSSKLYDPSIINDLKTQGTNTLVLVDDIIGNGNSFSEFASTTFIENLKKFDKVYMVTLLKTAEGSHKISKLVPNIKFIAGKDITKFDDSYCKTFTEKEKKEIKIFLDKYSRKIDLSQMEKFKNSQTFVTFDWNTPGTTPMPFCYDKPNAWKSIFARYNGLIDHRI